MTTDLRAEIIETMAQAMLDRDAAPWFSWAGLAEIALDAALETLDELRDGWNKSAQRLGSYPPYLVPDAKYLLAVLRAGKGSDPHVP